MILLLLIAYTYWRIRRLKDPSKPQLDPRTGEVVRIKDASTGLMRDLDARDVLDWELADYFKWGRRLLWLMLATVVLYTSCDASASGCDSQLAWTVATGHVGDAADVGVAAGWGAWFGSWRDVFTVLMWVLGVL